MTRGAHVIRSLYRRQPSSETSIVPLVLLVVISVTDLFIVVLLSREPRYRTSSDPLLIAHIRNRCLATLRHVEFSLLQVRARDSPCLELVLPCWIRTRYFECLRSLVIPVRIWLREFRDRLRERSLELHSCLTPYPVIICNRVSQRTPSGASPLVTASVYGWSLRQ